MSNGASCVRWLAVCRSADIEPRYHPVIKGRDQHG
jgi:hypothetical protein